MKYILIVCMLLFFSTSGFTSDSFKLAEQYYEAQNYTQALEEYNRLHKESSTTIDLLYNLGNTHFKLGHIGYAISYYRKALKWRPWDADIRYNLSLARKQVIDNITESKSFFIWILSWLHYISLNTTFYILMGCWSLTLAFYGLSKKYPSIGLFRQSILFNLICLILASSLFSISWLQFEKKYAVLSSKKSEVHSGPSETLPVLFYIHEGHELRIIKTSKKWTEIQLVNGFKGWIQSEELLPI